MKHRQEEDDLYRKFSKHREEENRRIRDEIQVYIFSLTDFYTLIYFKYIDLN